MPQQSIESFDEALTRIILTEVVDNESFRTISTAFDLSRKIEVKDYIVRKHITRCMGYTNFNQFINTCRIASISNSLSDPENRLSISKIAQQHGFKSTSSFYKYFKELKGESPHRYRNRACYSSSKD